ncbi:AraC family transcriptional regulator [Cohnella caldifontis]|uniref:AraC family transcriptional regulator n=1 Tax=Cohnella caldifontis TaxID=3027471 RepID=UPI0023EC9F49|nr:AraC family transcriptional regulator [Cohnella sp. YIM B05605]
MADQGLFRLDLSDRGLEKWSPRVYAYYFKHWNGFRMPFHRHDSTEVMYVISGSCRVEVQDGRAPADAVPAQIALKKNDFIVVGEGISHRLTVDSTCRMLNVEFGFVTGADGPSFIGELAASEGRLEALLRSDVPYLVLRDADEVYHSLKNLVLELDGQGGEIGGLSAILLAELLVWIARLKEEGAAGDPLAENRYVRQSLEYLRQNYDRGIQVKDVASSVNLHPGYLQRIFRSVTGSTLIETLTELRMDKAKMLLRQTNVPVTDIYDYVGIGSRQYFHALFKKHTGMTPMEYRESAGTERWNYTES